MSDLTLQLFLRRLAGAKNAEVGRAIGHDESHVSRILSGERGLKLAELPGFLSALGLRVVEVGSDAVTLPAEEVRAMRVLARKGLRFIAHEDEELR